MSRQNIFVRNLPRSTTREELADFSVARRCRCRSIRSGCSCTSSRVRNAAASIRIGAGDIAALLNLYLQRQAFRRKHFNVRSRGARELVTGFGEY